MRGIETSTQNLIQVPPLSSLYVKGARQSARQRVPLLGAIGRSDTLPYGHVVRTNLTPDADEVITYQHFFGLPAGAALPAGYLHVIAFPLTMVVLTHKDFPLPLLGMVHTSNVIEMHRAPELGEPIEITAWAENLRPHRRGSEVDICSEIHSGSELLWRGTSTYLARGRKLGVSVDALRDTREVRKSAKFVSPLPTEVWSLSPDIGRKYATLSGDVNPIHMSAMTAKALGFSRAIAHGMYLAARALASADAKLPTSYRWAIEFAAPVYIPGVVHIRTTVRDELECERANAGDSPGIDTVAWDDRKQRVHFTSFISEI